MNFHFNTDLASGYASSSQKIRVLTEDWISHNMYCPVCGKPYIQTYENNRPVADFYCDSCASDFELKSKQGKALKLINDGAYDTMIERISSDRNPHFFFLSYKDYEVSNLILVPNYFFTPTIIEKRKPLSVTARRAGWIGCNIDISGIPDSGKIFIVRNQQELNHSQVILQYEKTKILKTSNIEARGWLLDTLQCIEKIQNNEFKLNQVYAFEEELQRKHPDNNFIRDKLRQQLQILRDKGVIEFLGNGRYKKN